MERRDTAVFWNKSKLNSLTEDGASSKSTTAGTQKLQVAILANRLKSLERSPGADMSSGLTISTGLRNLKLPYRPMTQHNRLLQVRKISSNSTPTGSNSALTPSSNSTLLSRSLATGLNYSATEYNTYTAVRPLNVPIPGQAERLHTDVLLVRNTATAHLFVEKRLYTASTASQDRANAEVRALQQIRDRDCPIYINKLYDIFVNKDAGYCSLILEYCDAGTLEDKIGILSRAGASPVEGYVLHILGGLAKAIYFLHIGVDSNAPSQARLQGWKPLCHFDVTPGNVFLSKDDSSEYPRVVLGDFGSATACADINSGQNLHFLQQRGLSGWLPPESVSGIYGTATDLWQMGGVGQVLCKLIIVPDMKHVDFGRPGGKGYSKGLNAFIGWCMEREVGKRPVAKATVEWLRTEMGRCEMSF